MGEFEEAVVRVQIGMRGYSSSEATLKGILSVKKNSVKYYLFFFFF